MSDFRFKILIEQFIQGNLSATESDELLALLNEPKNAAALEKIMYNDYEQLIEKGNPDPADLHIREQLTARLNTQEIWNTNAVRSIKSGHGELLRWAAIILFIISGSIASFYVYRSMQAQEVAVPLAKITSTVSDVPPGSNKAVLTLDDGESITLDDSSNGNLAKQGSTRIVKVSDGQIQYHNDAGNQEQIHYNTLATPRGGQYKLILPDDTQVWLNAASSIRYPTVFTGGERKVEITGEVYFEVAHDENMPFRVFIKNLPAQIQVLGTRFNVNAYEDEAEVKTTLVEGSVKIREGNDEVKLNPGQQAQFNFLSASGSQSSNNIRVIQDADIAQVTAWKDGIFNFEQASLKDVMRQFSRWYDIEVVYEGDVPDINFGGKMGRDVSLSKVLYFFEGSDLHFRIEESKKLVITR